MDALDMAARIRLALIEAASQAWEDAGMQGLCAEGRWEAAVGAMQMLDFAPLVARSPLNSDTGAAR